MNCKTENEKSIEQIALEDYVWKIGTAKLSKVSNRVAFIIGGIIYLLSIKFLAYDSLFWNEGFAGIFICLFLCLMPAGMAGVTILTLFMLFSSFYRGKRKTKKFIASLSENKKEKIVMGYIAAEIGKWRKNIAYCENQIRPFQSIIEHNSKEIEKLESELIKFN